MPSLPINFWFVSTRSHIPVLTLLGMVQAGQPPVGHLFSCIISLLSTSISHNSMFSVCNILNSLLSLSFLHNMLPFPHFHAVLITYPFQWALSTLPCFSFQSTVLVTPPAITKHHLCHALCEHTTCTSNEYHSHWVALI